jgi:hypothetical protein
MPHFAPALRSPRAVLTAVRRAMAVFSFRQEIRSWSFDRLDFCPHRCGQSIKLGLKSTAFP